MAEHIYTTPALIFGSSPQGEADRLIDLLTESHGRVRAFARGIRRETSKLRYHLEPLRFASVSLLRGREFWRLVGAGELLDTQRQVIGEDARAVFHNAVRLLRRLLQGEESAPALFFVLHDAHLFLAREPLVPEELKNMECVLVLRILHELGYLGREKPVAPFLGEVPLSRELISSVSPIRRAAIMKINASIAASAL